MFPTITPSTTAAVFFDIQYGAHDQQGPQQGRCQFADVQFITHYQHASGEHRARVTTVRREWGTAARSGAPSGTVDMGIAMGFDQEAAAAIMGRLVIYKAEQSPEENTDAIRWLDRNLISLVRPCHKVPAYAACR